MIREILLIASVTSTLIALLVGIRFYKSFDKVFVFLFIYVACSVLVESIGSAMLKLKMHNIQVFNFFLPIGTTLLAGGAISFIRHSNVKKILLSLLIVWWTIWAVNITRNGIFSYLQVAFPTAYLLTVLNYVVVIILLNNEVLKGVYKMPLYIASIAIIVFFGCNIPEYSVTYFLLETDKHSAKDVHNINNTLSTIFYLMFTYAFVLKHKGMQPLKQEK